MNKNIAEKIYIARKIRGLSLEALSLRMNGMVTKQSISKYEKGKMQPSSIVLQSIADALDMPLGYFETETISIGSINFRIDAKLPAKSSAQIISYTQDRIEHYLYIENLLGVYSMVHNPLCDLIIRSVEDVEAAAVRLRAEWQLGNLPIFSVYEMLEMHGVKIIEFEAGVQSILGLSSLVNDSIPLIVINLSVNQTTERKRFTTIHELGHLFLRFAEEVDETARERYCHLFAGAVLCPAAIFRTELGAYRKVLTLEELISLRCRYGISIAAIVHRAKDLGIISVSYYNEIFDKYIHSNLMEEGWRNYPIEEHTDRFDRLLKRCVAEGYLTVEEAALNVKVKLKEYKCKLTLL